MRSTLRRAFLVATAAAALLPATLRAEPASADSIKLLASKDAAERLKGLEELAAAGKSAEAEKAVIALLDDEDWGVEIAACATLAKVGGDPARDALVKRALDGEIQWVRDAAVDAVKALDPENGGAKILERARNASTKDEQIRERACVAAGRIGGKEVLKKLTTYLGSKEGNIAAAAMRGMAHLPRDASRDKEILDLIEPRLGSARKERKEFFLYAACIEALGHTPGAAAAGMLVTECVQQVDDDLYVQERIGRGLEARPQDELASVLHTGFGQARKPEELRRIARLAGRVKCAGARTDLEPLLEHKDERVRSEAVKALGLVKDPDAAPALKKALEDKSNYVRLEAVTALARVLQPTDFLGMGSTIRKDEQELIRLQFVVEVNDLGDPMGIAVIEPCLADPAWRVASAAAATIGTLGVASDQPKLEPLLTHKFWQIRAAAYEGLGRLRAANAIPLLTEGLTDKDPLVKGVCHANLQILCREKYAADPKLWREWWAKNSPGLVLVKQSRRSAEEKAKEAAKNKDYGNQTKDGGVEILQRARILVVSGAWDHVEKVLDHLQIQNTLLRAQQLKDAGINPNQTILVNCEGNMDTESRTRVQWFVNVGGYLMTTDWALTKTIEPGFPGYLKQFSGSSTGNDVVVVEDAHPGHSFTKGIFDNVPAMKWWLEIQAFPLTVTWPERTDVLVDSAEMKKRYGSSPMAATFRWGLGKVQHSISHFFLQEEGMTAAQKPRDRMVFAADNLGLSLTEIRRLAKAGHFDGQITEEAMKQIAPDYSMFRLIVNVCKEKGDWVEQL
jgi:HEAT repeat protein